MEYVAVLYLERYQYLQLCGSAVNIFLRAVLDWVGWWYYL